jgi:hypothetical protein
MNILGYEVSYDYDNDVVVADKGNGNKGVTVRIGDYAKLKKNNGVVTRAEVYDASMVLENISSFFTPYPIINYVLTQFVDKGGMNGE